MAISHLIGTTPHLSPLLRKIRRIGYIGPDALLHLAASRGCAHYASDDGGSACDCGKDVLSDEEMTVALVSCGGQGDARHIRVAAQMLGAPGIDVDKLVRLARMERCVPIFRYIAEAGLREDSEDPNFWRSLLEALPETSAIPEGRMPHSSRFTSDPGWSPASRSPRRASWLRAHG